MSANGSLTEIELATFGEALCLCVGEFHDLGSKKVLEVLIRYWMPRLEEEAKQSHQETSDWCGRLVPVLNMALEVFKAGDQYIYRPEFWDQFEACLTQDWRIQVGDPLDQVVPATEVLANLIEGAAGLCWKDNAAFEEKMRNALREVGLEVYVQ